MNPYIIPFEQLKNKDVELVGGKNASIGEMISALSTLGVSVPGGFATTSHAYRDFLAQDGLDERIRGVLATLDVDDVERLSVIGAQIRGWMLATPFPKRLNDEILESYRKMAKASGGAGEFAVAVRSSATAEDLPEASFAGQQETFLNVRGEEHLMTCVHEVYASLFNDRAISYRVHNKFDHNAVALSVGVQHMVRSDLGSAGVMFTLDTESGFRDVVFITSAYGLGETVVQGAVNPDEFYVYKPALRAGRRAVLRKNLGGKAIKMVYGEPGSSERVRTVDVAPADRNRFSIDEADIASLAMQALTIEKQGRRHRQDLYSAGAAGNRAEPDRPHDPAVHPENPLEAPHKRPQHRSTHRRGSGAHHQRRQRNVPRSGGRCPGGRHDRSGLGTGDEARLRHRHQSRRTHLPCGDHRARTRNPGGGRLRDRDLGHQ
jgi:pyruvate,water dikinase